ncbi:MAG: response regulator [Planctomycetes bacterium]|nr:response regulator [Planctomycetota bacterium]
MFRKLKIIEMKTVLFVDDDEAILRSLERGLMDEPYNKLFTKSCQEALEILKQEEVHVIVTDMRMPEMSGLEFIKIVKKEYPHIIMIVLSGYGEEAALKTAVEQGEIFKLIPKPWKLKRNFEKLIRQAIDRYNLQNGHETVKR